LDRFELRNIQATLQEQYEKIENVNDFDATKFEAGKPAKKSDIREAQKVLDKTRQETAADTTPLALAYVPIEYAGLTILPSVRFTVPILLVFLAIWVGWRVVNLPVFADFLIATEAELNKVSWTTRKRLIQDTIVVLTTVVLLTIILYVLDIVWAFSIQKIGVLNPPQNRQGQEAATKPE
jgi:preprotein translocase SecE subunit